MTDELYSDIISNAISHNQASIKYAKDMLAILQGPLWRDVPGWEATRQRLKESLAYHQTALQNWRHKYRARFNYPALNS